MPTVNSIRALMRVDSGVNGTQFQCVGFTRVGAIVKSRTQISIKRLEIQPESALWFAVKNSKNARNKNPRNSSNRHEQLHCADWCVFDAGDAGTENHSTACLKNGSLP